MFEISWHSIEGSQIEEKLRTSSEEGLTHDEAASRLERQGANIFEQEVQEKFSRKILRQFKNPLVLILLIAGIATIVLAEYFNAIVIFLALTINVVISVLQEGRASRAFEKLSKSQERFAVVIRGRRKQKVRSEILVPGDLVALDSGSYVPADIRLLEAKELSINESALTGEWVAVDKKAGVLKSDIPLSERSNMAWMGTLVASGFGVGVVVETGGSTQIGSIAESLASLKVTRTPIQKNVRRLAIFLSFVILAVVTAIFFLGVYRGDSTVVEMLLIAIAVAVSVIPEGLPAAVTAVLAIGMERILARGGLVRNLLAAETLGSTTVILTDKTGTLTQAKMHVSGVTTLSSFSSRSESTKESDEHEVLTMAVLASDAFVEESESEEGEMIARGRPMEKAMVLAGLDAGISQEELKKSFPRKDYLAFEARNRFAASLNELPGSKKSRLYFSGAPETLLDNSSKALKGGREVKFISAHRKQFEYVLRTKGKKSARLIAVGYKDVVADEIPAIKNEGDETPLSSIVFGGLLEFNDPIRADVHEAIQIARGAGARVIMLTGDNKETAKSVAVEAGIATSKDQVVEGKHVEKFSDDALAQVLKDAKIFARVLPKQKLRIANILRDRGEVVAMTGDGVNDAPALQSASIGVSVGSGTEVAKEASDLILLNNSFSIIVAAIEEGRRIGDNLKKVVTHLLSTSFHEVFIIAVAVVLGFKLPILPAQILWVNILEEGLLNFGFAFEPGEKGLMKRDPRSERAKNILTKEVRKLILIAGIVTGFFTTAIYLALLWFKVPIEEIRTIMFVMLFVDSIFFAVSLKHLRRPFWEVNLLSNRYLLFALVTSVLLMVVTLSTPALRTLLSLTVLSSAQIYMLVGIGAFNLLTIELSKRFVFRNSK